MRLRVSQLAVTVIAGACLCVADWGVPVAHAVPVDVRTTTSIVDEVSTQGTLVTGAFTLRDSLGQALAFRPLRLTWVRTDFPEREVEDVETDARGRVSTSRALAPGVWGLEVSYAGDAFHDAAGARVVIHAERRVLHVDADVPPVVARGVSRLPVSLRLSDGERPFAGASVDVWTSCAEGRQQAISAGDGRVHVAFDWAIRPVGPCEISYAVARDAVVEARDDTTVVRTVEDVAMHVEVAARRRAPFVDPTIDVSVSLRDTAGPIAYGRVAVEYRGEMMEVVRTDEDGRSVIPVSSARFVAGDHRILVRFVPDLDHEDGPRVAERVEHAQVTIARNLLDWMPIVTAVALAGVVLLLTFYASAGRSGRRRRTTRVSPSAARVSRTEPSVEHVPEPTPSDRHTLLCCVDAATGEYVDAAIEITWSDGHQEHLVMDGEPFRSLLLRDEARLHIAASAPGYLRADVDAGLPSTERRLMVRMVSVRVAIRDIYRALVSEVDPSHRDRRWWGRYVTEDISQSVVAALRTLRTEPARERVFHAELRRLLRVVEEGSDPGVAAAEALAYLVEEVYFGCRVYDAEAVALAERLAALVRAEHGSRRAA